MSAPILGFFWQFKRSLCSLFSPDVKQGSHYVLTMNCFKTITIFTLLWSIVLIPSLAPPTKKDISKTFFDEHLTKAQNQNVLQGNRKKKRKKKRATLCRCLKKVLEDLVRLDMFNNNLLRNRLIIIFSLFETWSQLGNKNRSRPTQ